MDMLDLYERGTARSASKVKGAESRLDDSTPCDEWNVRALLNHMLDSQRWFAEAPKGQSSPGPSPTPPDLLGAAPAKEYEAARQATLDAYRDPDVLEKHGPTLGIGFVDQLVHGWDLARATGQDATIPPDLAEAAFKMINGRMDDSDARGDMFKPAVKVSDHASAQEKLLAYGGRQPA
jgi:uncharacterized protein (TIGR03086 family)